MSSFDNPALAVDNIGVVVKPSVECISFRVVDVVKDYEKVTIQFPLDFVGVITINSEKCNGGCEGKMPIGCQDDISDCVELEVVNAIRPTAETINKFEIEDKEDFKKETEATTSLKEGMKDNEKGLNKISRHRPDSFKNVNKGDKTNDTHISCHLK
jgi:hypothetical protein